ncbi:MAG: hypothetical protein Q9166_003251 [cf. Caloplaca sp. 2 TL-2023]
MTSETMPISSARATTLSTNLTSILTRISSASKSLPTPHPTPPRLVAVSKLKPANDILALFHSPHLHFGENYAQELLEKSRILPKEIRWHFIGALQTNKCRMLAEGVENLWCVSSVDSAKKADALDKGRGNLWERQGMGKGVSGEGKEEGERLRVCVQVNTSGEKEKSGVEPEEAAGLCRHVREECPRLRLLGLMTVGAIARSRGVEEGKENEDFVRLREVRDQVVRELGMQEGELELSMGMSEDFENAIRCGSDEVRVGSTIFGERPAKQDAKIKDDVDEGKE